MARVWAPAGTPATVAERLRAAILDALRNAEIRARIDTLGFEMAGTTGEELPGFSAPTTSAGGRSSRPRASRPTNSELAGRGRERLPDSHFSCEVSGHATEPLPLRQRRGGRDGGALREPRPLYNFRTFRFLETTGIGPGWHCLEVGGGSGSVAAWMADARALRTRDGHRHRPALHGGLGLSQAAHMELRRHDIGTDPLLSRRSISSTPGSC